MSTNSHNPFSLFSRDLGLFPTLDACIVTALVTDYCFLRAHGTRCLLERALLDPKGGATGAGGRGAGRTAKCVEQSSIYCLSASLKARKHFAFFLLDLFKGPTRYHRR